MKNSIYACMHLQKQIHVSIIYIHAHSFSSRMIALKKKIFSSRTFVGVAMLPYAESAISACIDRL